MSPLELDAAFLLLKHARLQDNACAMSHYSYGNQRGNPEKSGNQREKSGNQ